MRRGLSIEDLGDLLERPLVATLATYRRDGTVLLSPVWHEWRDGSFLVTSSPGDVKVRHLRRDPRAGILVYEHAPPYRGIEVRGVARLESAANRDTLLRIAIRYLGSSAGTKYTDSARGEDIVIRLDSDGFRAWDFADEY